MSTARLALNNDLILRSTNREVRVVRSMQKKLHMEKNYEGSNILI